MVKKNPVSIAASIRITLLLLEKHRALATCLRTKKDINHNTFFPSRLKQTNKQSQQNPLFSQPWNNYSKIPPKLD